jgi:hypothetical protein
MVLLIFINKYYLNTPLLVGLSGNMDLANHFRLARRQAGCVFGVTEVDEGWFTPKISRRSLPGDRDNRARMIHYTGGS